MENPMIQTVFTADMTMVSFHVGGVNVIVLTAVERLACLASDRCAMWGLSRRCLLGY
ncbi:hypothetical protein DPMN_031412 [Dreissena polymorpha]|uniref:Uncharacterized protein n=1 Tax=Dreissena polymorpha TaxID=45954 RepID=A0A9D4M1W4_DREPO|nr:hypothetical protein DPMN_031412 [Dreissena polymorpha]